jgi:hypothetical protein
MSVRAAVQQGQQYFSYWVQVEQTKLSRNPESVRLMMRNRKRSGLLVAEVRGVAEEVGEGAVVEVTAILVRC